VTACDGEPGQDRDRARVRVMVDGDMPCRARLRVLIIDRLLDRETNYLNFVLRSF
jgi:hypothetical protein